MNVSSVEHPSKAYSSMSSIALGTLTPSRDMQPENAQGPILLSVRGRSTLLMEEHPMNALGPIEVTLRVAPSTKADSGTVTRRASSAEDRFAVPSGLAVNLTPTGSIGPEGTTGLVAFAGAGLTTGAGTLGPEADEGRAGLPPIADDMTYRHHSAASGLSLVATDIPSMSERVYLPDATRGSADLTASAADSRAQASLRPTPRSMSQACRASGSRNLAGFESWALLTAPMHPPIASSVRGRPPASGAWPREPARR